VPTTLRESFCAVPATCVRSCQVHGHVTVYRGSEVFVNQFILTRTGKAKKSAFSKARFPMRTRNHVKGELCKAHLPHNSREDSEHWISGR